MLKLSFCAEIDGHIISLEEMVSLFNVYYVFGDNPDDYFWILEPIAENYKCPIFKLYEDSISFIINKDGFRQFDELKNLIQTGQDDKRKIKRIDYERLPTDVKDILLDVLPHYIKNN